MNDVTIILGVSDMCSSANISNELLIEIVELGIISPRDKNSTDWLFDSNALYELKQALRIRREFELDWPGTALTLHLFHQIEQLKQLNQLLQQRLDRFLSDEIKY